jgi:hypothetical protein
MLVMSQFRREFSINRTIEWGLFPYILNAVVNYFFESNGIYITN